MFPTHEGLPDVTFVTRQPLCVHEVQLAEARLLGTEPPLLFAGEHLLDPHDLLSDSRLQARVAFGPAQPGGCPILWVSKGLDDLTMTVQGHCLIDSYVAGALAEIRSRSQTLNAKHFGILWTNYHWQLFSLQRSGTGLCATCYDGCPTANTFDLEILCNRFMLAWGCDSYQLKVECCISQTYGTHCGAIALGHLLLALGHDTTCDEERYVSWHKLLLCGQNRRACGPHDAAMVESLCQILTQKGVPDSSVRDRATLAIKKLGGPAIQKALLASDPWRALKQIQPLQGRPFQFVLYNELQAHIAARASTKHGASTGKKGQPPGRKALPELHLCPEHLEFLPDLFVDKDGESVATIGVKEVVSDARGIALVTPEMAKQLDDNDQNLSIDALAVLVVGDHSNAFQHHAASVIQYPVIYRPTKEPALLTGTLLQLGDVEIKILKTADAPVVRAVDTAVVRVQVFRDAYPLEEWPTFVAGPVKALVGAVESLQFCPGKDCGKQCAKFHPSVEEELRTALLDVWQWQWLTSDAKPCKMAQADIFSVYLRVPASGLMDLLSHSGWNGVFIEPRPLPTAPSSQRFAVVWLPRTASVDDAFKWKRQLDQVVGLARMRQKLGVRVRAKDEEATLKVIFPDSCVRPCVVKHTYEAGPLPFGLHRDKIADLLKAWNWKARPLRPLRSTSLGQFWEIGAEEPPKSGIMPTDQGMITVSHRREAQSSVKAKPYVQAATKTLQKMHSTAPSSSSSSTTEPHDSWTTGDDPWKAAAWSRYQPITVAKDQVVFTENRGKASQEARTKLSTLTSKVSELEQKLENSGEGDATMSNEVAEGITSEIAEMRAQHRKYDQWFNQASDRIGALETHLHQQGSQIAELGDAMKTQAQASTSLQTQMQTLHSSVKNDLQAAMDAQTARLESLFAEKRQKTGQAS